MYYVIICRYNHKLSLDTELQSAMKACQTIRQKLDEVEKTLDNPDWKTLIETAYNKGVELCARYGYGLTNIPSVLS